MKRRTTEKTRKKMRKNVAEAEKQLQKQLAEAGKHLQKHLAEMEKQKDFEKTPPRTPRQASPDCIDSPMPEVPKSFLSKHMMRR